MLNENLKNLRRTKGLSQEELAVRLNVVRQTISKWERGVSVPDADMLIRLSEVFETPVSVLLGETVPEPEPDELRVISEKLEVINLQLANERQSRRNRCHRLFIALGAAVLLILVILFFSGSPYLTWNYSDPETAVAGTLLHGSEFVFVRTAPLLLLGAIVGTVLTSRKR